MSKKLTPAARMQALADLYAELPTMNCQGLCWSCCGSLVQTPLEQTYVRTHTRVELDLIQVPPTRCPALDMLNRCSVHEVRPMICRLWGMTPGMRCQFGCEPEGGFLTERQGYEFLARVAELGGNAADAARFRAPFEVDPEGAERAALAAQRHRDLEYDRRARRPGAVFVTGLGRLSKTRPRGLS